MQPSVSTRRQFHKYVNPYLVESGTYEGDGIADALKCGFTHISSFEVVPELYEQAKKRFADCKNVDLYLGTSAKMYDLCLSKINGPITFWLDGHYSLGKTGYIEVYCPLMLELEEIARHPIKTHTLLIDDRRAFGSPGMPGITEEQVKKQILKINPKYQFKYEDGHEPADILVAYIPKEGYISSRRQLHKYLNDFFVESGTFTGDGIEDAHCCGFKDISSFEVVPALYEQCKKRFERKEYGHVHLHLGTSAQMYTSCLAKIPGRITF